MSGEMGYFQSQGYNLAAWRLTKLDLEVAFQGDNADKIGNYVVEDRSRIQVFGRKAGRTDLQSLKERLADYLSGGKDNPDGKYNFFRFKFADDAKAAFEQECRDYHFFKGKSDNQNHPDRPNGTSHVCPHPGCTELKPSNILADGQVVVLPTAGQRSAESPNSASQPA